MDMQEVYKHGLQEPEGEKKSMFNQVMNVIKSAASSLQARVHSAHLSHRSNEIIFLEPPAQAKKIKYRAQRDVQQTVPLRQIADDNGIPTKQELTGFIESETLTIDQKRALINQGKRSVLRTIAEYIVKKKALSIAKKSDLLSLFPFKLVNRYLQNHKNDEFVKDLYDYLRVQWPDKIEEISHFSSNQTSNMSTFFRQSDDISEPSSMVDPPTPPQISLDDKSKPS